MAKKTQHFVANNSSSANKDILESNLSLQESILSGGVGAKDSPCYKSIDLRDKTQAPHSEHFHKGIKFYFDQQSLLIFEQGLKDNNNL